jgi:hypothetical protein
MINYLPISILLLLVMAVRAQSNLDCLTRSPVYGTNVNSFLASDVSYLRSDAFDVTRMTVRKILVCGTRPQLNGIRFILADKDMTSFTDLTHVGQETSCSWWQIQKPETYFRRIELAYDAEGPTWIKAVTSTDYVLTRGELKDTDSRVSFDYTPETPLIGLQAYETANSIKALGFIRWECFEV